MSRTVWPRALGLVLVLGACQPSQTVSLPVGPQVVDVEMADYRFQYKQPVSNGRVLFRVANTGKTNHSLSLLPLSDDIPPIDQQLRGSERRAVIPVAAIKARPPGTTTSFAVDLARDRRYAMVCFVEDVEGSHALRGMASEFRVAGTATKPESTGTSTGGSAAGRAATFLERLVTKISASSAHLQERVSRLAGPHGVGAAATATS